jgi:type III pantothenate kinase
VNEHNEYLGGAISPGLTMRLKAMNAFTHALPLIEMDKNFVDLIGTDTKNSMLSGALIGAVAEVDGIISKYLLNYANLQVVLTGGDADYLGKQLKNRLFANQNLLLYGLNTILNYNLEK